MGKKRVLGGIVVAAVAFATLTPGFGQASPPAKEVIVINDQPIPITVLESSAPLPVDPGDSFQKVYEGVDDNDCTDIVAPGGRRLLVQSVYFEASVGQENVPQLSIEIRPEDDTGPGSPFIDRGPLFGTPTLLDRGIGFWRGSLTNVHLFEDPANGSDLWVCFQPGEANVVVSGRLEN